MLAYLRRLGDYPLPPGLTPYRVVGLNVVDN
jgi:hypothetical protein